MTVANVCLLVPLAVVTACSGIGDTSSSGSTLYQVNIQIAGSTNHVTSVQVCVQSGHEDACGPDHGFPVGTTQTLSIKANPGDAYTVEVPSNQMASPYCTVTAGASGAFQSSTQSAVVTCS